MDRKMDQKDGLESCLHRVLSLDHTIFNLWHTTCLPCRSLTICSWSLWILTTRALQQNNLYVFCENIAENITHYVTQWQNLQKVFFIKYNARKQSVCINKWAGFHRQWVLCNSMLHRQRSSSLLVLAARKVKAKCNKQQLQWLPSGAWYLLLSKFFLDECYAFILN